MLNILSGNVLMDRQSFQNYFAGLQQTRSNEFNEDKIVEKGKLDQLRRRHGSASFYGGIVFPTNFDYDDVVRTCTSIRCRTMDYKIRFISEYTESRTNELYSKREGGSFYSGM